MKKNNGHPRKLTARQKRIFTAYALAVCVLAFGPTAALADGDPIATINKLSDFIFSLIRAVGGILVGWGIVQVGLSIQSHDPTQRSQGFLTLAGGVVVFFAKEILSLIAG
jgi:hypothetical protein